MHPTLPLRYSHSSAGYSSSGNITQAGAQSLRIIECLFESAPRCRPACGGIVDGAYVFSPRNTLFIRTISRRLAADSPWRIRIKRIVDAGHGTASSPATGTAQRHTRTSESREYSVRRVASLLSDECKSRRRPAVAAQGVPRSGPRQPAEAYRLHNGWPPPRGARYRPQLGRCGPVVVVGACRSSSLAIVGGGGRCCRQLYAAVRPPTCAGALAGDRARSSAAQGGAREPQIWYKLALINLQ